MDGPCTYEIRVEGHLTERWSNWFEGLAIHNDANGQATLSGQLSDQAALLGVLNKIHALNLLLISVFRRPVSRRLSPERLLRLHE